MPPGLDDVARSRTRMRLAPIALDSRFAGIRVLRLAVMGGAAPAGRSGVHVLVGNGRKERTAGDSGFGRK